MIAALALTSLALGATGLLGALVLVVRRLALARAARRRQERERRLRPLALAVLDGEGGEEAAGLPADDVEILAAMLARYSRQLSGGAREHVTAFFEGRGDVERELRRLGDRRVWRRASAAHALGDMGSAHAISGLRAALADPARDVRTAAARSLGTLGAEEAVDDLVAALVARGVPRGVVGQALLTIGMSAVGPLAALVADGDAGLRPAALELVGLLGDAGDAPAVQLALVDEAPEVRAAAARALGRLGAQQAVADLRAALGDGEATVRTRAALALGAIGDLGAVPALLAQAQRDEHEAAHAAAHALARIVPAGLGVVGREPAAGPHLREAADIALAAAGGGSRVPSLATAV